jgi:hypothetical protein
MNVVGGNGFGKLTQTAGTVISRLLPPRSGAYTRLMKLVYTAAGTAHVLTVMRAIGTRVKLSAGASASQAVISLTANPGPSTNLLAANDYLCLKHDDGVYRLHKVSSIATLDVTLTANLPAVASINSPVWMFGVAADTDPTIGEAHNSLRGVASVTSTYVDDSPNGAGLFASHNTFEPLLVQSDNATAAGTLEQCNYCWSY